MPQAFIVTATLALAALGALGVATPTASAQTHRQAAQPSAAELQMPQDAAPFRAVADAFVKRAMAGETDHLMALLTRSVVAHAGEAAARGMLEARIVPFFRAARPDATPGRSATITRTTDAAGHQGFAFYLWATMADGASKPFTLYVVDEGGRLAVANVVPDRLVEGRHR